jgi:hypothetical protein
VAKCNTQRTQQKYAAPQSGVCQNTTAAASSASAAATTPHSQVLLTFQLFNVTLTHFWNAAAFVYNCAKQTNSGMNVWWWDVYHVYV